MASLIAINAVCSGIAQQLRLAHQLSPVKGTSCQFAVVGSKDLADLPNKGTTCAIFLYRVTHNEHTRNPARASPRGPLTVNLHLLFSMWADSPLKEHTILGWLMRELYDHPVLDRSVLGASGEFTDGELVQLIPEELTLDDMSKLWQLLVPPYRLSASYIARNVSIGTRSEAGAPVAATRFGFTAELEAQP
jgi:hypothetical protein